MTPIMKKYDLIFSLGRDDACSAALRQAGLQALALPWDRLAVDVDGGGLAARLDIMESGFDGWFREEDLELAAHAGASGKDVYRNRRSNLVYAHDFAKGVPLHEAYPAARARYDRLVERFKRLMDGARDNVLAVYMDAPDASNAVADDCRDARRRLQALYPHVKVDFLMIALEPGRRYAERTVEDSGDGFIRIAFDFRPGRSAKSGASVDTGLCAAAMRSVAAVREYKDPAGIKKPRRTLREKMREAGAANLWQYFLFRRRREFARMKDLLFPRIFLARIRRKKYDHVLSLGMNCEPAFRFSLSWGFVDSTPFSWASSKDVAPFIEALRRPEHIACDGFSFLEDILMWKSEKTGITFHGRLEAGADGPALAPEALADDKADLVHRLAYLNEKFTRILSDDSSKALVYRVDTRVALAEDINAQIASVQSALEERGARNYTLVVVTERSARGRISSAPNRMVRTVKKFNPRGAVTRSEQGDPVGWRAIYSEFTPKKILPKKHAFKFERH